MTITLYQLISIYGSIITKSNISFSYVHNYFAALNETMRNPYKFLKDFGGPKFRGAALTKASHISYVGLEWRQILKKRQVDVKRGLLIMKHITFVNVLFLSQ